MKVNVPKTLLCMFLLAVVVGGLSTNAVASGGPAPTPEFPPVVAGAAPVLLG